MNKMQEELAELLNERVRDYEPTLLDRFGNIHTAMTEAVVSEICDIVWKYVEAEIAPLKKMMEDKKDAI